MIIRKKNERKQSCPTSRYYPNICLEELRKTKKSPSQNTQSPGCDLKLEEPSN
jgi:hypothetical protein